ncbi:MAG: flagellin lysine-N-methylase [Dialister sp.]|nr:flagellin lysine-N-methylase [Dialister sp.]
MHTVYPSFYPRFACKAGACRHTCCQKWEIAIDDATAESYQRQHGELGEALQKSMIHGGEGWRIAFNEKGLCPLLEADGLCRIVKEIGDDSLCDICREHPRFYTYVDDYELCGLGLCCEAASELLLRERAGLSFEMDGKETLSLQALCERIGFSVPEKDFHVTGGVTSAIYKEIIGKYSLTEPIDEAWTKRMAWYRAHEEDVLSLLSKQSPPAARRFDLLLQYILYRRLEDIDTYGTKAVTAFARAGALFVYMEAALTGSVAESMRRWSEQIEYDTDNVDLLLSEPLIWGQEG